MINEALDVIENTSQTAAVRADSQKLARYVRDSQLFAVPDYVSLIGRHDAVDQSPNAETTTWRQHDRAEGCTGEHG